MVASAQDVLPMLVLPLAVVASNVSFIVRYPDMAVMVDSEPKRADSNGPKNVRLSELAVIGKSLVNTVKYVLAPVVPSGPDPTPYPHAPSVDDGGVIFILTDDTDDAPR